LSLLVLCGGRVALAEDEDTLWVASEPAWSAGRFEGGAVSAAGALTLREGETAGAWEQTLPEAACDRLVLSLNPDAFPSGAQVRLRVRVRVAGGEGASPWLPLGIYGAGPGLPRSERAEPWEGVRVETDLVRARGEPISTVEVRVELQAGDGGAPRVRRLAVSRWLGADQASASEDSSPAWGVAVEPPQRSQCVEDPEIAGRICSPTSLGMALALHGHDQTTLQVAQGVYDHGAEIYGNWSFNVAYAASLGLEATALHLDSLADLEAEIAAGRPEVQHSWLENADGIAYLLR
jgi:hypothetical protein